MALASSIGRVGNGVSVGTGEVVIDGIGVSAAVGVNVTPMVGDKVGDSKVDTGDTAWPHAEIINIQMNDPNNKKTLELFIIKLIFIGHQQDLPILAYSGS